MAREIIVEIVLDSAHPQGDEYRLTTVFGNIHKFILAERNRHRMMSLSDRSSRAVPTPRLIREIRDGNFAMPVEFRRNISGMAGGEILKGVDLQRAKGRWEDDAYVAAERAERAHEAGEAKETVNRRLDSYIWCPTVMTATRDCWLNFAGLRLDKSAQPEIRVFAEKFWAAWNESRPKLLGPGQWHLPYFDDEDGILLNGPVGDVRVETWGVSKLGLAKRWSAGRCAHTSYYDFETEQRMTLDKALSIYDRLVTSRPLHASPTEHQASPDELANPILQHRGNPIWMHPKLHGNLPGWIQERKQLPGERIAQLPEGYVYNTPESIL